MPHNDTKSVLLVLSTERLDFVSQPPSEMFDNIRYILLFEPVDDGFLFILDTILQQSVQYTHQNLVESAIKVGNDLFWLVRYF